MLQISIISIGKTNEAYVQSGIDKYVKLLSKYAKVDWKELADVKNSNKLPVQKLKELEAELILSAIPDKACVFFLDEIGKTYNSVKFADYLNKKSIEHSKLVFVIGGAFGLDQSLQSRGEAVSLSAMTFNHQMVRVILAEQIFRAFTIIKGTTYHH